MLLVNQSANVFFFGDFNIHHKDWLTYSGGTDRPSKLLWISISNDLTQMVSFLLGSLNVTLIVLLISIYFFLLTLVFILQRLSLLLEIFIILLSQFPLPFFSKSKQNEPFCHLAVIILVLTEMVFMITCFMGGYLRSLCLLFFVKVLIFTKWQPFKNYEKCFLFHL